MAMTKAEKAKLDKIEALQQELRLAKAFSWPIGPEPEPLSADEIDRRHKAAKLKWNEGVPLWHAHVWSEGFSVQLGCSNGSSHSTSVSPRDGTYCGLKGCGTFFESRLDALLWARHKLTRVLAEKLARIDREIEVEATKEPQ
jgi:hypothetical protein